MFDWLLNQWDHAIYAIARPSILRICERNPGIAYLLELWLHEWRESHQISAEVALETEQFFMKTHKKAWHDCPTCAKCHREVCVIGDGGGEHLHCAACGHRFRGTDAEHEQAKKADAAWDTFDSDTQKEKQ